jgi:hypothetical protein
LRRHRPGVLATASSQDEGSKDEQKGETVHLLIG